MFYLIKSINFKSSVTFNMELSLLYLLIIGIYYKSLKLFVSFSFAVYTLSKNLELFI